MTTALQTGSLDSICVGGACRVSDIDECVDPSQRRRLAELGIRPGSTFSVTQRIAGGGLIIKKRSTRYAIDRSTAARIGVEVLS